MNKNNKPKKPLRLDTQTVRTLADDRLEGVAGGGSYVLTCNMCPKPSFFNTQCCQG